MKKPTLSACLIVKNEELHIRRCLKSIVNAVDEICIIDTGCTDRTIERAREFGAKIAFRAWDHDFSAARNASLDLATSDWVMQIDADEELYQSDIPKLRELLERQDIQGIGVILRNFYRVPEAYTGESVKDPMNVSHSTHRFCRVFRRLPQFRYEGRIHECIRTACISMASDVSIFHYGYAMHGEKQKERADRNYGLCLKEIERDPDNPAPYFYMATTCIVGGKREEAEHYLRKAIETSDPKNEHRIHFYLMALYELANLHSRRQDYAQTRKFCEQAIASDPHYIDPWLRLGEAYFFLEHYWAAERALRRYLELREEYNAQLRTRAYSVYLLNSQDYAYFLLGRCAQEREDFEEAERYYRQCIECNQRMWGPHYFLSQVLSLFGRNEEAESELAKAKELNPTLEAEVVSSQ